MKSKAFSHVHYSFGTLQIIRCQRCLLFDTNKTRQHCECFGW